MKDFQKMRTRMLLLYLAVVFVGLLCSMIVFALSENMTIAVLCIFASVTVPGIVLAFLENKYFRCPHCDAFLGGRATGEYCRHCGKAFYETVEAGNKNAEKHAPS